MRKLFIGISVLLIIVIAGAFKQNVEKREASRASDPIRPTTTKISLNAIMLDDASEMVANFLDDHTSTHAKTAIWLSKKWVDNMYILLNAEKPSLKTDGFRIYFAKRLDNGNNTIVIVSTKEGQVDPLAETGKDHLDYFDHDSPFLLSIVANNTEEEEEYSAKIGATLYHQNPHCPTTETCPINTMNYISCGDANEIVRNFGKTTINTNSEWFPLDLVNYLHDQLNSAPSGVVADGIRIYFAKNGSNVKNNAKKNRHAFVIVTTQLVNGYHYDNYQCYPTKKEFTNDNGEECPNNCNGVTLPQP